ncbi:unannotated protein [freshwater metagenome]|uniref:Unannotated protein n=1 Tax=freshwater metagenome TaxID=449393 RepID=A0A6J6U2I7_9ZZZZ
MVDGENAVIVVEVGQVLFEDSLEVGRQGSRTFCVAQLLAFNVETRCLRPLQINLERTTDDVLVQAFFELPH